MFLQKPREVILVGRGKVKVGPNDYVATGGEGSIYKLADGTIIKLYTDTGKMIRDAMSEKIALLTRIQHPYIVAPTGLVTDTNGSPLGFSMPFVGGEPLSRVFTNDFRVREGFADEDAATLVDRMRETVSCVHQHQTIMVDANELNWIVVVYGTQGPEPRVLDVDSWMIGKWPATVIMPSIRDWRAKQFGPSTDWFAWGVVTFQVFTGIHPYKGTLAGYKPAELERRMKDGASVFAPGVRLNAAVRDFNCIRGPLLEWYRATFQQGERSIPPSPFDTGVTVSAAAKVARVIVTGQGILVYDRLLQGSDDPAIRTFSCGVVLRRSGQLYDLATKRTIGRVTSRECEVVTRNGGWLVADWEGDRPTFSYINGSTLTSETLSFQIRGFKFLVSGNRLFTVTDRGLTELVWFIFGKKVILGAGNTWGAQVNSTRWYDGVGIQDSMGATFVIVPFGEKACAQIRVKELDGLIPLSAKAGNRFVAIMAANKSGEYCKVELTMSQDHASYTVWQSGSDTPDLNMAMLPKGVVAGVVKDGELFVFVPTNNSLNKVNDRQIATDMILGNWGDTVVYIHDGDVWSVRMRS